jgi:hypothetical protein
MQSGRVPVTGHPLGHLKSKAMAGHLASPSLSWKETLLSEETNPVRVPGERIEQRTQLRAEQPPVATTLIIRGGPDTVDQLRRHAERTVRAWSLDGVPLLGISVFAVLDLSLDDLLRRRFASFRTIYLPTAGRLAEYQFELLPTGQRPHFTVQLRSADAPELDRLLAALGAPQANSQYARDKIWREED